MNVLKRFIKEVLDGFSMSGLRRLEAPGNLRYDVAVKPNDNIPLGACPECGAEPGCNIDCEECMSYAMNEASVVPTKQAACVLVISEDGQLLAVSRKNDPSDLGMPGGKVDPGETPYEAAKRELQEETGLIAKDLKLVFRMFDGDSDCHTFLASVEGEINTNESGVIKWVDPQVLLRGSFADYNYELLTHLNLI